MKKRFMSVLCLLMVACMSFTLVACNGGDDPTPENKPQNTECTTHVDVDKNGSCDTCGAAVEVEQPDVPSVDVTKDVANAVEKFNTLKNGNVSVLIPAEFKIALTLSNMTTTGEMFEELGDVAIETVEIDGSKIHMTMKSGDDTVDTYLVVTEDGYYGVTTDGTNYEHIAEKFDKVETTTIPDMTADDLVYEESTGYFVVKETYLTKLMGEETVDTNLDDYIGVEGLDQVLADMEYEIKFRISAENTISELSVKGAVTQNDIRTEHLAVTYKQNEYGMKVSMTVNYYVNINLTMQYLVTDANHGTFSINMTMVPPVGSGMTNQNASYSVDVAHTNSVSMIIPAAVQAEIDKAATILEKSAAVEAKYGNVEYTCESDDCSTVAIYDAENEVYVLFNTFWGTATYSSCSLAYDNETVCYGTLVGTNIIVSEHCIEEQSTISASDKYSGIFTCPNSSCETVVVYDEELGMYIMLEQDFLDEENYEFYTALEEPWGSYCVGTVDLNTKVITVTEHSPLESFIAYVQDRSFTAIGYNNCDTICVYEENSGYYVMFSYWNGKLEYCGYSSCGGGCIGTIDLDAGTITITSHES